jgi:hypothetical protein
MKASWITLAVFALGAGVPALAQAPSTLETQMTGLAGSCLAAKVTPETAQDAVMFCDKLVADLAAFKQGTPNLMGHDLNVFHVVMAMAQSRVANSYGKLDGVRSARVCERMELSWQATSAIDPGLSPSYATMIKSLVDTSVSTTRTCRNEFGAPPGAIPLPQG